MSDTPITDAAIREAYSRLQSRLNVQTLGLLEIGSHANGEAVRWSDRDFRIVIHTSEPYCVLREHEWSLPVNAERTHLEWRDLNNTAGITFGISNIGLNTYCATHWPAAYEWFQKLYAYKVNEDRRQQLFNKVLIREPAALQVLWDFQKKVTDHWEHHKRSIY